MHVSQLLYDRVEAAGGLGDDERKDKWRGVAKQEVAAAVKRATEDSAIKMKKEEVEQEEVSK
jgi:hypothetical protein